LVKTSAFAKRVVEVFFMTERERGVVQSWGIYQCRRCGNKKQQYFASFYHKYKNENITYCRRCIGEGQANTTETLQISRIREVITGDFCFVLPFALTPEQQKALFSLRGQMRSGTTMMLQAVCGAGKTEIIASLIATAVRERKYVGWAIARRDVVIEITERLQQYFPQTSIIGLYQNSPDLMKAGQLVVLTTARLYEFYRFFDILIVDENDAFPFSIDNGQKFAARQAIIRGGITIHISATIKKHERHTYQYIRSLARRFHDYPLPLIKFQKYHLLRWWQRGQIGKKMQEGIDKWLSKNFPVFVFVSNKKLGRSFTLLLQKMYGKERVVFVSSEITNRTPILQALRAGNIDILVTTTILERGVTYKNLQVIVLDADASLFDAQTLVQIAGRVGRSIDAPDGEIIFCYQHYITKSMRKARHYHVRANEGEVIFL